jgi:hypothetical protein
MYSEQDYPEYWDRAVMLCLYLRLRTNAKGGNLQATII